MKIYNLKNRELIKLHKEFNKTSFGKRAKIFSTLPLFVFILLAIFYCFATEELLSNIRISLIISLIGGCISQLMYGNMLKDFIDQKNDSE